MNSFINRLVDRHIHPEQNVKPRMWGRFDREFYSLSMPDHDEPQQETNELTTPFSFPVSGKRKTTVKENEIERTKEQVIHKNIPSAYARPLASVGVEKNDPSEKKYEAGKITEESLVADKNSREGKNLSPAPATTRIDDVQKNYFQKKYFIRPGVEKKQQDQQIQELAASTDKSSSPLYMPGKSTILDKTKSFEDNKKDQGTYPFLMSAVKNKTGNNFNHPLSKTPVKQAINISIGRIEIRATTPQPETRIISKKEETSRLSLEQYLEQRNKGKK